MVIQTFLPLIMWKIWKNFFRKKSRGNHFHSGFLLQNHRPYKRDIGEKSGEIPMNKIIIPPFLPDDPVVRKDMADYLYEIQWFDKELGRVLQTLADHDELDNTVIVFTSDNGMPFPRAKSNNYEYGTHVPFAVRWGNGIADHQEVTDFISLTDIALHFLIWLALHHQRP
ncbi:MAG: sulfatase-like hydrolase/transferase [Cellvibrionales bacterium]|nr:sulfatase-like hydrolase/transferase [Cellvibrionales bacterium]